MEWTSWLAKGSRTLLGRLGYPELPIESDLDEDAMKLANVS